jgi:hypothetical protein
MLISGIKNTGGKIRFLIEKLPVQKLRERFENLSPRRRGLVFWGSGLLMGLFVILLAVGIRMNHNRSSPPNSGGELSEFFGPQAIPLEELFLPAEPDFLPEVFLEREPQEVWAVEDVRRFWFDPLEDGDGPWRERIESIVDGLLESVP